MLVYTYALLPFQWVSFLRWRCWHCPCWLLWRWAGAAGIGLAAALAAGDDMGPVVTAVSGHNLCRLRFACFGNHRCLGGRDGDAGRGRHRCLWRGNGEETAVHHTITLVDLVVGWAGLLGGVAWLLWPGPPLPMLAIAAQQGGPVSPLDLPDPQPAPYAVLSR
ncbi:MAG: hypothetical protein H6662_14090 [Ardenticatenaceae bacterium]|nr:hypothetical protein [Ardenticatenaceae bacterium]